MQPLLIDNYDYPLPENRIAKYPLPERDSSKLLVWHDGEIQESRFCRIGNFLPSDALLVRNNTRVIQARLVFHKKQAGDNKPTSGEQSTASNQQGARIEIFLLEPVEPSDYQLALSSTKSCVWKCMIGNLKKWKTGALEMQVSQDLILRAEKSGTADAPLRLTPSQEGKQTRDEAAPKLRQAGDFLVQFSWENEFVSFAEIIDKIGELPIPPYLNRKTEESDKTTYQTVYSAIKGSVAAPTAGLHFTPAVLSDLEQRGIQIADLTLHVGAGTFQPVKTADANEHPMHREIVAVPKKTIETIKQHLGNIVAVGTTSVRTLESLYYWGEQANKYIKTARSAMTDAAEKDMSGELPSHLCPLDNKHTLSVQQFEPYEKEHSLTTEEALEALLAYLDATGQDTMHAETQIMIKPGFCFRIVNRMITNFHQPRSTLLLLVSAFVGEKGWRDIYRYALDHDFRFLSYGDSSLLVKSSV